MFEDKSQNDIEETAAESSCGEAMSPIDMLLDEHNTDNIVLYTENGDRVEFQQIALIPLRAKTYVILKPVVTMPGMGEDDAIVFVLDEVDGEDCFAIVLDEAITAEVFEEYYKLLDASE